MSLITAKVASSILGISKRTLLRWSDEGKIRSKRDGILRVRVYDINYIEAVKKILELDRQENEHLKKLPEIRERVRGSLLEREYIPGEPLKIASESEMEASMRAFEDEEAWLAKHKRLLNELFSFPGDIIRELLT